MPRRIAIATASVRSRAPSLSITCLTCTLTVSSEMNSRSAMSLLRLPLGDVAQHLDLARSQGLLSRVLGELRRHVVRDPLAAGVDLADRLDQLPRRHALEQVAARAGRERALDLDVALEGREHDDASVGELGADGGERVDAAHVGQAQVHERHVGPLRPVLLDASRPVRRLGHELHVGLRVDQRADPLAQQRMVVHAQDSNTRCFGHCRRPRPPGAPGSPPWPAASDEALQPPEPARPRAATRTRARSGPAARSRCPRRARSTPAAVHRSPPPARACPRARSAPRAPRGGRAGRSRCRRLEPAAARRAHDTPARLRDGRAREWRNAFTSASRPIR